MPVETACAGSANAFGAIAEYARHIGSCGMHFDDRTRPRRVCTDMKTNEKQECK